MSNTDTKTTSNITGFTLAKEIEAAGRIDLISNYSLIRYQAQKEQVKMLVDIILWVVRPVRDWIKNSNMRNELETLDDRILADIGISRSDIPSIIANNSVRAETNAVPENLVFLTSGKSTEADKVVMDTRKAA